jgi:hypothetical protein
MNGQGTEACITESIKNAKAVPDCAMLVKCFLNMIISPNANLQYSDPSPTTLNQTAHMPL